MRQKEKSIVGKYSRKYNIEVIGTKIFLHRVITLKDLRQPLYTLIS